MQKIYFFIGTKAQAIKCIPLINLFLTKPNLSVVIVNSGQHTTITESIFQNFEHEITHLNLFSNKENISKYSKGIVWVGKFFLKNLIFKTLKNNTIENQSICVVHGDTVSTILGLFWGKRNKCKVMHLESGLTSNSLFNPFPEEIIRRITSRLSDILICFDPDSYLRLKNKLKRKLILQVSENTILETLGDLDNQKINKKDIVTATLHRTENILSKKRLISFVKLLEKLSENYKINWYLHEPTINSINKFNIKLSNNITTSNLISHEDFINQLKDSKIVVTDGGSIQEECYYLGNTTIVWRNTTERPYAMNENMYISKFNIENSLLFLLEQQNKKINIKNEKNTPSKEIYNFLLNNQFILND